MYKLNVQFDDLHQLALCRMAKETGKTKAGVIRTALALLEVAIRERNNGNSIAVIRSSKVVKHIVGIF